MNPYSRFRLASNTAAAALIVGGLCAAWPVLAGMIAAATGGLTPAYWASIAAAAVLLVVASLTLTEAVFPALFQLGVLRRLVLGRNYVEGTWLQAERGPPGSERLTVLHIRPSGFGYDLSGYSLNQESEIESNRMVEYSKLDGPVLFQAYRSLMPDGAGTLAKGTSELLFESGRGAPKTYSGYGEPAGGARRFQIEGVKLTRWSERRGLRKLDQRAEIVETYWNLFFGAAATEDVAYEPPAVRRPVIVETAKAPFVERRNPDSAASEAGPVITRRRASDWRGEDATPTADRIRARMMLDAEDAVDEEEDDILLEEGTDEDLDEAAEFDARLEDEDLDLEDETELGDEVEEEDGAYDASAEDEELEDEPEEIEAEAPTEEEPIRIRQRYARR